MRPHSITWKLWFYKHFNYALVQCPISDDPIVIQFGHVTTLTADDSILHEVRSVLQSNYDLVISENLELELTFVDMPKLCKL